MEHLRLHDTGRLKRRPAVHPERRALPPAEPLVRRHDAPITALRELAEQRPDAMLHVFVDPAGHYEIWRAGRMVEHIRRCAAALARDGLGPGDTAVLGIAEPLDLVTAWHACAWLGAAPVVYGRPLGRRRDGHWRREMLDVLVGLDPKVVLVDDDFAERATEHLRVTAATWRRMRDLDAAMEADGEAPPPVVPTADDIAFFALTQGSTTGAPRPIAVDHRALLTRLDELVGHCAGRTTDLVCSWLPLNPRNGLLAAVLVPALYGVPSVLVDPMAFMFEPAIWPWAMHAFRGSISTAPGRGYDVCARAVHDADLPDLDLTDWRLALVGGEMTHPEHLDTFEARFGPLGFRRTAFTAAYGGAESMGMATCGPLDEPPFIDLIDADRLSTAGVALPETFDPTPMMGVGQCTAGLEVRVVAPDGQPVGDRTLGAIELRGIALGHQHGAAAPDAADWLATGDVGYRIADELVLCGRDTDLLRIDGRRCPAVVAERALDRLTAIRWGCVVIDQASPEAEESSPVVVFEHTSTDRDTLEELLRDVEAIFTEVVGRPPDRVVPVRHQGLPRAPNGQLRRSRVLAMLRAGVLPPPLPGLRLLR